MEFFYLSVLALIIGSFASFVTYRLGESEFMLFSYSKCPKCNYRLKFYNLVPLISWLLQCGKCTICKAKISFRYPMIEIFFVALFNVIFYVNGFKIDYNLVFLLVLATIMVIISIVDLEYYFAPLSMQILLLLLVVGYLFFAISDTKMILYHAFCGVVFMVFSLALYYLFLVFAKKEAIGIDDIKLFYTIGLLISLDNFVEFTFYAGLLGIVFGLLWTKIKKDDTFPFAPTILTSAFLCFILDGRFELVDCLTQYFILKVI